MYICRLCIKILLRYFVLDILELYYNDTRRLHPLLAVVSDIYENIILCWKIVRELKMGGLTAKRRWL